MNNYHKLTKELIEFSYKYNLAYLPSSLSMLNYLSILIPKLIDKNYKWVAGKQFGTQAYYTIYNHINRCDLIPEDVTKPLLLNKVNKEFTYIEETLGNSLGVAIGMSLTDKTPIWLNVSDSIFQMGRVLEALPLLTRFNSNILITIDGNNCTRSSMGKIESEYIRTLFMLNNIPLINIDLNDLSNYDNNLELIDIYIGDSKNNWGPRAIYFNTIKGERIERFEMDPITWHYKRMTETEYNEIIQELEETK